MARPTVKDADFVGREAYLRKRDEAPVAVLCTLTVDDPTSSTGVKRYMLGREPILTPGRRAARRRQGPPVVRDERRLRAVGRQAPADVVPAAGPGGRGQQAARRVLRRALPGDGRGRRRDAAVRPRERADPELTPSMNILVCVKRVPATGGRIVADRRRPGDRHAVPRLHGQPARGVRRRGGGPDRRGEGRRVRRADARPGRGRRAAARRDGDRHRPGGPARDRRLATGIPLATAARDRRAIRRLEAAGGPFDLILFGNEAADTGGFQVGIRVAVALGPAGRHRDQGARVRDGVATARRRRRPAALEIYELPLPAVVGVREGINLPRYPSVPGRLRAKKKEIETSTPERVAGGGPTLDRLKLARGAGGAGRDPRAGPRGGARASSSCSGSWASCERHPGPGRERRRRAGPAERRGARVRGRSRGDASAAPLDAVVVAGGEDAAGAEPRRQSLGGYGVGDGPPGRERPTRAPTRRRPGPPPSPVCVAGASVRRASSRPAASAAPRSWPTSPRGSALPMAANVVAVEPGEPWRLTRQRWAGSLLEDARSTAEPRLLTVAPHAVAGRGAGGRRSGGRP